MGKPHPYYLPKWTIEKIQHFTSNRRENCLLLTGGTEKQKSLLTKEAISVIKKICKGRPYILLHPDGKPEARNLRITGKEKIYWIISHDSTLHKDPIVLRIDKDVTF